MPLRFAAATAVAGSMIGEIGALAGGLLPNAMGMGKQWTGSYAPGFLFIVALAIGGVVVLGLVTHRWTHSWVGAGGRVREPSIEAVQP